MSLFITDTMQRFDEQTIERFVRYPDTFAEEDRENLEAYLRSNPQAKEIAAFYREFYAELDALKEEEGSDRDADAA